MATLTSGARSSLPDSAFAYVEPGHAVNGKTPDKYRHFPIHDAAHVRNALARIGQGARFGAQAKGKVMAAAKRMGISHADSSDTGRSLESLYPEVRFLKDTPEVRTAEGLDSNGDKVHHITGYAAAFDKISRRLGGFVERVMPSAFEESRSNDWPGVICRYNHKPDFLLGTTGADTCRLATDDRGLHYDVIPPNHRGDVLELVQRGDVRYSSFAFRCVKEGDDEWDTWEGNTPRRSLLNVELVDVAPVQDPAYFDTDAKARSMIGAVESLARWVDGDPSEVRSMMEAGQAMRFFKRTDRPSAPRLDKEAVEARGNALVPVDDPAALRSWEYSEPEVREEESTWSEERAIPTDDEFNAFLDERAMKSGDALCQRWVAGEPCVRPTGHDGEHKPLCWRRKDGLPCARPMDHDGDHEQMAVNSRDAENENVETREEPETEPKEERGMTAVQASKMLADLQAKMVRWEE